MRANGRYLAELDLPSSGVSMAKTHKRLGDLLLEANCITPRDLDAAVASQRRSGERLGATLIRMGVLSAQSLLKVLQAQLGLAFVDLQEESADEQALSLIKEDIARKYVALPLRIEGRSTLVV